MPAVFVHGNPEIPAIWEPMTPLLGRDDVVALAPPGFGAPVPEGFGATYLDYRDWLISELETIEGPIDLVGHDWGGGHVLTAVLARPDLVRSWCTDIIGVMHPDYVWHDAAQGWQTEGVGEEMVQGMAAAPLEARIEQFESLGIPTASATALAGAVDAEMGRCILALYRSAAQPAMAELGAGIDALSARPGLVIIASEDHYVGTDAMAAEMAGRAGADVTRLDGLGHWWMLQDPERGAAALGEFWAGLS